jgi:2-keto-4-pentenoate hydratase/2-oxohepta-3-ene-1,7-dioic acid hydratase in catechol pathway
MNERSFRSDWQQRFGNAQPKVVCVGLNYSDHTDESGFERPKAPLLFGKFANAICSDGDAIVLPTGIGHVDAEAELAVVIGETAHGVTRERAFSVVAGYLCANDVSAREAQFGDGQWFRGKGYDTFCPLGPRFVSAEEMGDPSDLRIQQRVNGEVLQDSRTSKLIFDIPQLISYASSVMTLDPGDLILTGTPEGVGYFREPKLSLRAGDIVEVEIERIGVLRNVVREAAEAPGPS